MIYKKADKVWINRNNKIFKKNKLYKNRSFAILLNWKIILN